jgi:hypothetical protein
MHATDAAYCRPANWWKDSHYKPEEEMDPLQHGPRTQRRKIQRAAFRRVNRTGKQWSVVLLESGAQNTAGKKPRATELEAEFTKLVRRWKEETFHLSSLTKVYAHPAYQRIMAMGTAGIPLILRELQNGQGRWFYALKFMVGKDISEGINDFEDAKAAWLEWGYNNNYI